MMAAPEYLKLSPAAAAFSFWSGLGVTIVVSIVVLVIALRDQGRRSSVLGPVAVMILGAAIFASGAAWLFWPGQSAEYFPTFEEVTQNAPEIGQPVGGIKIANEAYLAHYRNAILIWAFPPSKIYRLHKENSAVDVFDDQTNEHVSDEYYDELAVRRLLKIPNADTPPWGGPARLWHKNPKDWEWIGSRLWHCAIDPRTKIRYQEFTNGIVLTTFPVANGSTLGRAYYIANGKWVGVAVSAPGARCRP